MNAISHIEPGSIEIVPTLIWEGDRAPLAKAFVAAQMATEAVKKAATNPAFKTKYADLSQVVEGVIPALNAAGVGLMQFPAFDGEMVSVTTTMLHESGSSVSSVLHLRPSKSDPQGVGSAITYARRYALLAMTGAAPEDDDGNASSGPSNATPARPAATPASTPAQSSAVSANQLDDEMDACKSQEALLAWEKFRLKEIGALPKGKHSALGAKFQDLMDKLPEKAPAPAADDLGISDDDLPEQFR